MSHRTPAIALALLVCATFAAAAFARTRPRYLPEYNASGELNLPKNFNEWIYVGSPLTPPMRSTMARPASLNITTSRRHNPVQGVAAHTARGKRGWLAKGAFGTRVFPWRFNGADVTVKDSKRLANPGGVGILQFQSFRA
jgi:hypothetical protein